MKMKKIMLIGLLLLLVGCNSNKEPTTREQYCLDKNMTFDGTYVLQPNWTRCCGESTPTNFGTYRQNCDYYEFIQLEINETDNTTSVFLLENFSDYASLTFEGDVNLTNRMTYSNGFNNIMYVNYDEKYNEYNISLSRDCKRISCREDMAYCYRCS